MTLRAYFIHDDVDGEGRVLEVDELTALQFLADAEAWCRGDQRGVVVMRERACRKCGCTDDQACAFGCYWVEADLCSECR